MPWLALTLRRLSPSVRAALAAAAVLVLAGTLRLPRGDLAEWKSDEAIEFTKARAIVFEGDRPRGVPTTEGPRAPPHQLYAFALPLLVADSPESCRLFIALLSSGAIAAFVWTGQSRRGRESRAVVAAGLALAVLPHLVRAGRWAWFPNLVAPVATLVLAALLRTVAAPRGRAAGALLALSVLLGLLHYAPLGIAALGIVASFVALARGADRRAFGLGLGAALVLAAPFVAQEVGSGFETTRSALGVAAHGGRASQDAQAPERERLAYLREIGRALDLEAFARGLAAPPAGSEPPRDAKTTGLAAVRASGPSPRLLAALGGGLALLAAIGAALGLHELALASLGRKRISTAGAALLFTAAAASPFVLLRIPAREHYVQGALPAVVLLAGVALERVTRRRKIGLALGVLFLAALGTVSVREVAACLDVVDAGGAEPGSSYDLPYRDKRAACDVVLGRAAELGSYRRHEDVLLLAQSFRELTRRDPEQARRFTLVPQPRLAYWELDYALPLPLAPRHDRLAFVTAPPGSPPLEGELARCGSIVVQKLP